MQLLITVGDHRQSAWQSTRSTLQRHFWPE